MLFLFDNTIYTVLFLIQFSLFSSVAPGPILLTPVTPTITFTVIRNGVDVTSCQLGQLLQLQLKFYVPKWNGKHNANTPMQYAAIFKSCKNDISDKKERYFSYVCLKHRSWVHVRTEAVLISTHDLCFRAKLRKRYTPAHKHQFKKKNTFITEYSISDVNDTNSKLWKQIYTFY